MKIKDIVREAAPMTATTEQPTQQEIQAVQQLVNTLPKEKPESAVSKLTAFMGKYPVLDVLTDFLPQTRLVKLAISAVDSLEKGDKMSAVNALASGLTGGVGKAVDVAQRAHGVATAVNDYNKATQPSTTATALAPQASQMELEPIEPVADNSELERIKQLSKS